MFFFFKKTHSLCTTSQAGGTSWWVAGWCWEQTARLPAEPVGRWGRRQVPDLPGRGCEGLGVERPPAALRALGVPGESHVPQHLPDACLRGTDLGYFIVT